eukprot:3535285-Rhodomonas_salina.1
MGGGTFVFVGLERCRLVLGERKPLLAFLGPAMQVFMSPTTDRKGPVAAESKVCTYRLGFKSSC